MLLREKNANLQQGQSCHRGRGYQGYQLDPKKRKRVEDKITWYSEARLRYVNYGKHFASIFFSLYFK